jgi:hypothetical protein
MNIRRRYGEGVVNWIRLSRDKVHWWAVVNTVMNLKV